MEDKDFTYNMELSLYNRQEMISLNKIDTMVIIGCGGIGSNLAFKAGMIGVKKFILVDYDNVSYTNLSRTPFVAEDIGKPKTTSIANRIKLYRDIGFETLYITEFKDVVSKNDLQSLEKLIEQKDSLKTKFLEYNEPLEIITINPITERSEYDSCLEHIKADRGKYLVIDTTDRYLRDEDFESNKITLLSDYKLNYDGTQISVLTNPFASKGGELFIPIDQMRISSGYRTIPSFFLSPDILISAFLMYILKRKEGLKHKDTVMFNVELEDFLSSIFNVENTIKYN